MTNGDRAETTKCPRIHAVARSAVILSIVVPMLLAAVLPVRADFTYNYIDPGFNTQNYVPSTGPQASTYIHGSVTFTSVTAGESWGASDITSFVLAAGPSDYYTVSSANGDIIEQAAFYFDAQGNMTSWFFVVWSSTGYQNYPQFSIDGTTGPPPDEGDMLTIGSGNGAWATFDSSTVSGTWTAAAAVPAPGSITLLGSSLLGLAWARRKKGWRK